MAWSSGFDEDQGTDDNQELEQDQEEAQEPEPLRPRQVERNQRGGGRAALRAAPARARRIVWSPRNHGGWGARSGNRANWTTRLRPQSNGKSYITREGEEKKDGAKMAVIEDEMALGSPSEIDKMDTSLWLGDTGTSCHMTNNPCQVCAPIILQLVQHYSSSQGRKQAGR